MIQDMKTTLTRLFTVMMLIMVSMGVGAKVDVELNKEYKGGKVEVKSQEDKSDGSTLVTITVSPAQGNTITHSEKKKSVIVYAVLPAEGKNNTRALEISSELEVTGSTATISYPNSVDYQFTVPAGLNAWVQDIKFQENMSKNAVATPIISFGNASCQVSITCATDGASIYYRTDGSDPDLSAVDGANPTKTYSGAFAINGTTTVKAIAKVNDSNSDVQTSAIEFNYALITDKNGYLKNNVTYQNNFNEDCIWTHTSDGYLKSGSNYIKDNGSTITTTTDAAQATVWVSEIDAENSLYTYFKTNDDKYIKEDNALSTGASDLFIAYRTINNNIVVVLPGEYVIASEYFYDNANDLGTGLLTDPGTGEGKRIDGTSNTAKATARWIVTMDDDGFYSFQNVGTNRYITLADNKANTQPKTGKTTPNGNTYRMRINCYRCATTKKRHLGISGYNTDFSGMGITPRSNSLTNITLNNYNSGIHGDGNTGYWWYFFPFETTAYLVSPAISGSGQITATRDYTYYSTASYYKSVNNTNIKSVNHPIYTDTENTGISFLWSNTSLPSGSTMSSPNTNSSITLTVATLPDSDTSFDLSCKFTIDDAETTITKTIVYVALPPVQEISHLSQINNIFGNYKLNADISEETIPAGFENFSGILDGNFHSISGLSAPLFETLTDAIVRNLTFKNVNIGSGDSDGDTGTICSKALGTTSIYNCGVLPTTILRNDPDDENKITGFSGSSVTGSRYVGSLVGFLGGTSRVINCFSYADVTGGSAAGGIVGYNNGTTTASSIQTMVMNCMFYGDIKGGTSKSPVYGGNNINNLTGGLNTFNYYRYESSYSKNGGITDGNYNCALALEDKYLVRFEFYRQLLNSNKRLAAIYATGSAEDAEEKMAKWVLETADRQNNNPMPFPVLKAQGKYPSIINFDAEHAEQLTLINGRPSEEDRNKGGKIGTLSVTISAPTGWTNKPSDAKLLDENGNETTSSRTITLNRTDKDEARFNFNYDKVQLPYYNDYGTKNYTDNKVVTGWKITSITPTSGEGNAVKGNFKEEDTWGGYNFADRKTYAKDLYSKSDGGSGRVFSQGAYYDVPYGVTAITIEPYWGKAVYVSDANYDVVYNNNDNYTVDDVPELGTQYTNNSDIIINESTQKVYTSISDAVDQLTNSKVVYDNALVLVGNLHLANVPSTNKDKGFTMMSIDLDSDNEPDYSLIYHHDNRQNISPIRFDFLNVPGTAMAQKPNGSARIRNVSIFSPTGWFEVTNTCNISIVQFECDNTSYNSTKIPKASAPVIFQGGMIDQFVSTKINSSDKLNNTPYIHVGGTAWFNAFGNGTHSDGTGATPHVPVSVTGGDFEGFYLTGTYQPSVNALEDDAECYISGGRFKEAAGASQEQLKGDAHWQIYDADIEHFYGGGINAANNITGNIIVDIFNSHVTQYCGGPKFGDMETDKTVTTEATGCTFGKYFGAGYGGISYLRLKYYDEASTTSFGTWDNQYDNGDRGKYFDGERTYANSSHEDYGKKGPGIATDLDYELFVWSDGRVGGRFYVKFASFSLATCNNVNSTLTNCIVNQDFYGGGSSGKVAGTATSKLDGCIVHGNVFGAGYKSEVEKVNIRNGGFVEVPKYNSSSGMFEAATLSGTTPYEWKNVDSMPRDGETGIEETDGKKYIQTKADFNTLGQVDKTVLTITGNSQVDGKIVNGVNNGGVFGGGDESATIQDTEVTINTTGESSISNVYGGGNIAPVGGNTVVTLKGNTLVSGNVFGGGNEATVSGSATVNIVE